MKKRQARPPIQMDAGGRAFCPGCLKYVPFDRDKLIFMRHEFTASGEPCDPDLDGYRFLTHDGYVISGRRATKIRNGDTKTLHKEMRSRTKSDRFVKASASKQITLGGSMMSNRRKF